MLLRPLAVCTLLLTGFVARAVAADTELLKNLHAELNPPAVPGVTVHDVKPTSAGIEWPASLSTATTFRVEMRAFSLGEDRTLRMDWIDFPSAAIHRHGDHWHARVAGLKPNQPHWFRVLPKAPSGSEPLFAVSFRTPAPMKVFTWRRAALAMLVLVLGVLLWLRMRR